MSAQTMADLMDVARAEIARLEAAQTHAVYGVMLPGEPAVRLFAGSEAECRYELARLGRGRWADLHIFPTRNH